VSEIERLVREVEKETDHVDILFANAGASWGEEFLKVDEKNGWDRVMDLNVKAVFFTVQKYVDCSVFFSVMGQGARVGVDGRRLTACQTGSRLCCKRHPV
jgi:hypothetical protein